MKKIFALFGVILVLCTACSPVLSTEEEKISGESEILPEEILLPEEETLPEENLSETVLPEVKPEEPSDERENTETTLPETEQNEGQSDETVSVVRKTKKYIRSKVDGLNVRSAPSVNSSSLGTLDKGDMVAYCQVESGWYQTKYRGKDAYVSSSDKYTELFEMDTENDIIENIIEIGTLYLGAEYVYGAERYFLDGKRQKGFTTEAFDCSSYMQYIFYRGAFVILRETTRTQVKQGKHVDQKDLRRGDLIFMTNASRKNLSGIERVGHVALYLGDNYILHTASDHAVIEPMNQARWDNYIEARRMV